MKGSDHGICLRCGGQMDIDATAEELTTDEWIELHRSCRELPDGQARMMGLRIFLPSAQPTGRSRRGPAHHVSRPQTHTPIDTEAFYLQGSNWTVTVDDLVRGYKIAPRRPAQLAERTQCVAVALLSPTARALFADELRDELYDLAEHGAPRRRQFACVLRQAAYAWKLTRLARSKQAAAVGGGE